MLCAEIRYQHALHSLFRKDSALWTYRWICESMYFHVVLVVHLFQEGMLRECSNNLHSLRIIVNHFELSGKYRCNILTLTVNTCIFVEEDSVQPKEIVKNEGEERYTSPLLQGLSWMKKERRQQEMYRILSSIGYSLEGSRVCCSEFRIGRTTSGVAGMTKCTYKINCYSLKSSRVCYWPNEFWIQWNASPCEN